MHVKINDYERQQHDDRLGHLGYAGRRPDKNEGYSGNDEPTCPDDNLLPKEDVLGGFLQSTSHFFHWKLLRQLSCVALNQ
jgi:hypothetical protein